MLCECVCAVHVYFRAGKKIGKTEQRKDRMKEETKTSELTTHEKKKNRKKKLINQNEYRKHTLIFFSFSLFLNQTYNNGFNLQERRSKIAKSRKLFDI